MNKLEKIEDAIDGYEGLDRAPFESDKKVHFLDYMAKAVPYEYVPYPHYLKAVRDLGRLPSSTSLDVIKLQQCVSNIREKLFKRFGRDLLVQAGVGVRATVDEDDRLNHHRTLQGRAKNAVAKVNAHAATVNVTKIKDAKAKAGFIEARKVIGTMNESMLKLAKLLPPKTEIKEDRKK
jgi:hypothetical protein